MIRISHLSKRYQTAHGVTEAIRDISFDVAQGEFVSVVGPSGAGKSTLLKALAGLHQPSSGAVQYQGKPSPVRKKILPSCFRITRAHCIRG